MNTANLSEAALKNKFAFEVYGVKIGVETNSKKIIEKLKAKLKLIFPEGWKEIGFEKYENNFEIFNSSNKEKNSFIKFGEEIVSTKKGAVNLDSIESKLRLTVAEFAEHFAFIHAGAVAYKGFGIIIPAKSYSGKSTLVSKLIASGCVYYSDEYALIDENGLLHPFAKTLSIRQNKKRNYRQKEVAAEKFGAVKGTKPVKIGFLLFSKYKENAKVRFNRLSAGQAIINTLENSISIRQSPQFVLKVIGKVASEAVSIKTNRGEADDFADKFLSFVEKEIESRA